MISFAQHFQRQWIRITRVALVKFVFLCRRPEGLYKQAASGKQKIKFQFLKAKHSPDSIMSTNTSKPTQLGFAEDQEAWLLTNRFFPSKIGGAPAWLELQNIPDVSELLCDYCSEPCVFLCQVYETSTSTSGIQIHRKFPFRFTRDLNTPLMPSIGRFSFSSARTEDAARWTSLGLFYQHQH